MEGQAGGGRWVGGSPTCFNYLPVVPPVPTTTVLPISPPPPPPLALRSPVEAREGASEEEEEEEEGETFPTSSSQLIRKARVRPRSPVGTLHPHRSGYPAC